MIQYPMHFTVQSKAKSGIQSIWDSSTPTVPTSLELSIPPEFSGPGGGYSPEDIYAMALANCFVATFKVFAEKSKIEFGDLTASGTLTVDRNESGVPWMKAFHLKVELNGVNDSERARRLLEKTSQSCMILNSVKTEKSFEFLVS
jgi:organic hydroperoxide reductase OsmC/OhrA